MKKLILGMILGLLMGYTAVGVTGLVNKPFTFVPLKTAAAAEVNQNFDTIYNEFNGNITNANISSGAAIVYSKLNLTGSIINSDINSNAAIAGSKLNLVGKITTPDFSTGTIQPTSSSFVLGTARQILCGTGLSGCGDLSSDRTLAVVDNTTIQKVLWGTSFDCCVPRRWGVFANSSEITTGLSDDPVNDRVVFQSALVDGSITTVKYQDASVSNIKLKTATGSAASGGSALNVTMNTFSFFPSITSVGSSSAIGTFSGTGDPGDQIGRFQIAPNAVVNWRYVTSSRPPELVLVRNRVTGEVLGVWHSEINETGEVPIISSDPNAETVFIAQFPDRLLASNAKAIMMEFESNKLALSCPTQDQGRLNTEAKSKGRVMFKNAKLCEVG